MPLYRIRPPRRCRGVNSFQYFQLKEDASLSMPIRIFHFAVEGDYTAGKPIDPGSVPKHQVAYFEYSPQVEICDVLFRPVLLVKSEIKKLWQFYEPHMKYKGVQVFANDTRINVAPMYWCPMIDSISCMDVGTQRYPDRSIKRLVLQFQAVQGRHIFQVAGLLERITVVSLPVAESMLKRSATGFQLQAVDLV